MLERNCMLFGAKAIYIMAPTVRWKLRDILNADERRLIGVCILYEYIAYAMYDLS